MSKSIDKIKKNNEEALLLCKRFKELYDKYDGVSLEELNARIINKINVEAKCRVENNRQKGKSDSVGHSVSKEAKKSFLERKIDNNPRDISQLKSKLEECKENNRKRLEIEKKCIEESISLLKEKEKQELKLAEQRVASSRLAGQKVRSLFKRVIGKINNSSND